jgi:cysteine-rich repeat protein
MLTTPRLQLALMFLASIGLAACGGGDGGPPDATSAVCGNGTVEGSEQCDDGNDIDDDACDACVLTCGDGVVNEEEECDTGISTGEGACPTTCDDGNACTTDQLTGDACLAACSHGAITATDPGDGCCPAGEDINTDSDCPAGCGNGVVEPGETCDTAITAGMPGACPASCDDGIACTTDTLFIPDTGDCGAVCQYAEITATTGGDGCCPAGATSTTDADCSATCGDGTVDTGETCDTGIAAGNPGACPNVCDDGDSCTVDALISAGTCDAACAAPPITGPVNGDGCCPAVGNANNDDDCAPDCGNGVVEAGEQCDDGGELDGDGCDALCQHEPIAFRVTTLRIVDPHLFISIGGSCADLTTYVNDTLIADAIEFDGDDPPDGLLDLTILSVFQPLAQAAPTSPMDIVFGDCTAPLAGSTCSSTSTTVRVDSTANNMATGECLGTLPDTLNPAYTAPVTPDGPCYVSDVEAFTIQLGSVMVPLEDAYMAGTYVGNPATSLADGLIRGFISEETADATILPADLPLVGGQPLSALLGGSVTCTAGTIPADDRDMGPGGVLGWYFYVNVTSAEVPYSELP